MLKLAVAIAALGALATSAYFVAKEERARTLADTVRERFGSGEYLAALAAAGELQQAGRTTPELEATIAETARFLVAEDTLKKARQAAEEGRYADARALLSGSEAVANPAFKYYEEAKKLYAQAEALAAGAAHKTAVTISSLEERAAAERARREQLERNKTALEGTLSEKEKTLAESRAEIQAAKEKLAASQKETEVKQAALLAEEARTKALMEQVEKESTQKFFTELKVYRDMAQKGKEQLDAAVLEITAKRDVTALLYLSQGKILLEEARVKTGELKASRTPAAHRGAVDTLLQAVSKVLEAGKHLRNAVVYIDDQGSAEFIAGLEKGKAALSAAIALFPEVSASIAPFVP
ncbi:MAG: hypothetical protein Greene041679_270 [Parcubacteria group bacterium Greene0416_79]|nr:MAG: hypothetical protein Greene041679_270 [Parcubacteria group bacterium Greene0416_79]